MEKRHIFKKKLPFGQKQQSVQQKWGFLTGRKKVGMHAIPIFFFFAMNQKIHLKGLWNLFEHPNFTKKNKTLYRKT